MIQGQQLRVRAELPLSGLGSTGCTRVTYMNFFRRLKNPPLASACALLRWECCTQFGDLRGVERTHRVAGEDEREARGLFEFLGDGRGGFE